MVSENINDFINHYDDNGSEVPSIEDIEELENIEDEEFPEDEEGDEYIEVENSIDQMRIAFKAEIAAPEYSRVSVLLKLKNGEILEGVPMAELSSGDFLFKIEGQIKKIKLAEILNFEVSGETEEDLEESYEPAKAKFVYESSEPIMGQPIYEEEDELEYNESEEDEE